MAYFHTGPLRRPALPWLALAVCGLLLCSLAAAAPWDGAWLEEATSGRPLITTFYYPSWPGVQILGLANHDEVELALLRPAFDAVISVDNGGDFGPWAAERGLKTLLHPGHEYGASICGQCTLSEADKAALPDWAELKLDGSPTSRTCLAPSNSLKPQVCISTRSWRWSAYSSAGW